MASVNSDLFAAGCVGAASWTVFRNSKIRGDCALLFYTAAGALLYTLIRLTSESPELPFTTTVKLGSAYALSLLLTTVAYRVSPFHPLAKFPGPVLCKVTGLYLAYISFTGKRHSFLDRQHARYGRFVRAGPNIITVNSPTALTIYDNPNTTKSELYRIADRDLVHSALFFKPDTKRNHRDRRRIWHGLFTTAGLKEVLPSIERRTWQLLYALEQRQQDGVVDVGATLGHWAFDVMGDVVFGGMTDFEFLKKGDSNGIMRSNKLATTIMDSVGLSPWLLDILWHLPATKTMHASRDLATSMMRTRMKAERALDYRDLSSYWMEGGIPENQLELDAVVAMTAGSDTTASNLTFCVYFLTAHPDCARQLRQELDKEFPNPAGMLDMDILQTLPYLNGVIHESLRLTTPYFMPREVPVGGMVVDDHFIPHGTDITIATNSQHMSEENFYPDPLAFRPARWIPGGLGPETKTNKNVLCSFGLGEYACIGKMLAYQEMRHTLSRMVLMYDFAFPEGFDVKGFPHGMQYTRSTYFEIPLRLKVTRRPGVTGFKTAFE
ncbi:hypothetical protein VTO73DRAFT_8735 [Trametes versicolor]